MASDPLRPRLAAHASVRRHLSVQQDRAGIAATIIVHDLKRGGVVRLGEREWALLRAADGTRDLEGIRLAAASGGAHATVASIEAFFGELTRAGLVIADATSPAGSPPEPEGGEVGASDRVLPVVALPDFRLTCDGRGSCCRLYPSVLFSRREEARARALCPDVQSGGDDLEAAFTPEQGGSYGGAVSVALVDGACAYLGQGSRCRIHAAGGAAAKPRGCQLFPALFVDDGRRVVVSPMLECACVLASADRTSGDPGGEPLVPVEVVDTRALGEEAFVHRVPRELRVGHALWPRDDVTAWTDACRVALRDREPLEALAALAHSARAGSLLDPLVALRARGDLDLGAWLTALHERLEARARDDSRWRSAEDLALLTTRWMRDAAAALLDARSLRDAFVRESTRSERFYVDTFLFGHHLLIEDATLDAALLDRVVRILLARAMRTVGPPPASRDLDGAIAEPLALVEAMMRGHGLAAYRPSQA